MLQLTQPERLHSEIPVVEAASITPHDLAVALCLLEGDNYKALQTSDYLQHLSKGRSDKIKLYNETTEKIKLWVTRSILHHDTVSNRSQAATFYINTAFVSPQKTLTYP
jgi:son of sevenless-like protein